MADTKIVDEGTNVENLVVIVPCFNEVENIRNTVEHIRHVAKVLPLPVHVLMIDDGSTDGTKAEIEALCESYGYEAMYNKRNQGVGSSLLAAYERIPSGSWVTIMPGDNEIEFASIAAFLEMRESYDVILGYLQNSVIRPVQRRLASVAYMRTVRLIYGLPYRYLNGMKLFRIEAFRGIQVEAAGHAFNSELIAKAILRNPHIRIGEAPFIACGRGAGMSKAIRPISIAQSILEVGKGWRSVAKFRDKVIKSDS